MKETNRALRQQLALCETELEDEKDKREEVMHLHPLGNPMFHCVLHTVEFIKVSIEVSRSKSSFIES